MRRFAQPLGIELPKWEGRVIETKKGVVRLLPIAERAKQLFGEDGARAVAARFEQRPRSANPLQGMLFPDMAAAPEGPGARPRDGRGREASTSGPEPAAAREATTLDRVHAAMLLQASGRTNALRALLEAEQDVAPISFASPTRSRRSTRSAVRRSGWSTRCCSRSRDKGAGTSDATQGCGRSRPGRHRGRMQTCSYNTASR